LVLRSVGCLCALIATSDKKVVGDFELRFRAPRNKTNNPVFSNDQNGIP
jgi:hypothetical protein